MGSCQKELDQLRLIRSPNIGPVSYRQLMARFGSARAALDDLPDLIRRGGGKHGVLANASDIVREFQLVQTLGARHVFMDDADYPYLLSHLDNAPPVICVKGDLGLLARPTVASSARAMHQPAPVNLRDNWRLNLVKWDCLWCRD